MRLLFFILTIMAFAFTSVSGIAQGTEKSKKPVKKISCCVKGECKEMTQADCNKAKGKKVSDCSKCKPVKATKQSVKSDTKSKPAPTIDSE